MSGIASPDIPAFYSYAIVLIVGLMVARSTVDDLLTAYPDRWAFADTWLLFSAHAILPVALFWFLDYTGAIQDTSLFAALVVAAGYKQIFSGAVQGMVMPGQTPALWRPFESWIKKLADRIATRNKQYRDRFIEVVKSHLASSDKRLSDFEQLVRERTTNAAALDTALAPAKTAPGAAIRTVDVLLRDFRSAEPENYGYLLYRRKLIPPTIYWWWFEKGKPKLMSAAFGVAVLTAIVMFLGSADRNHLTLNYYHWRFLKPNATLPDRFRSREFLSRSLHATSDVESLVSPLTRALRFEGLTTEQADHVLRFIVDEHSPKLNAVAIPHLIAGLKTANSDVRLRIQNALCTLHEADYKTQPVPADLLAWVPAKADSPGEIDRYARNWRDWWLTVPKH